ncbi:MAG: hypothetical protein ACO1OB_13295 [Archangium sp.]
MRTTKETPAAAVKSSGWGPSSSKSERKVLESTVDAAITGGNVNLAHLKHVAATFGKDSTRVITERLTSKLPASSPDVRAGIYRTATALGADSKALKELLMNDAINSGDARFALELIHDGAKLNKADATKLAPHIRGDEVLSNPDSTKSLTRAAVDVLKDQPAQLAKFAGSLSSAALLFGDVLANKDTANYAALKPLVKLLTAKEAEGYARRYSGVTELSADFRKRAAEK